MNEAQTDTQLSRSTAEGGGRTGREGGRGGGVEGTRRLAVLAESRKGRGK